MILFIIAAFCAVIASVLSLCCLPNVDRQHRRPMTGLIAVFAIMAAWLVNLGCMI